MRDVGDFGCNTGEPTEQNTFIAILLPLGRGTCTARSATGLLTLRLTSQNLPALRQWFAGCKKQRRLQLRGSSGVSPLSRASRCHLQRHRLQEPPTDDFKNERQLSGSPSEAGTPKMGIWPVS